MLSIPLLSNGAATGTARHWPGGRGVFTVCATWNGATIQLETLGPDGTTWLAAGTYTTLTANGMGGFELPEGQIRCGVSGGPPSAVYATVKQTLAYVRT